MAAEIESVMMCAQDNTAKEEANPAGRKDEAIWKCKGLGVSRDQMMEQPR